MKSLLLLVVLICATNLAAKTYYVATTGNDSNKGSASSPWRTISHAASAVQAGDTVIVEDGRYAEAVTSNHSGTSSAPITFQSRHKWGAVLAPSSAQVSNNSRLVFNINGSDTKIVNFEITGSYDGTTAFGIKLQSGAVGGVIRGNKVHHISASRTVCPGGGAAIESAQANAVVTANFVYDVNPPRGSSLNCGVESGIYITNGDGTQVTNNLVINVWQGASIQLSGEQAPDHDFPSHVTVTNNTIINGGTPGVGGYAIWENCAQSGSTCDYNVMTNNLAYGMLHGNYQIVATSPGGTWGSHNIYSKNLEYKDAADSICCKQTLANTINADPRFVQYTGGPTGDYHLQSTSPAIRAGTSTGAPSTDFDGHARPQHTAYAVGAYEYVANVPTHVTAAMNRPQTKE
ncbi:MAG: right-handed parallel beta-helix repeat-containing protein [Acidobacteria bacterium]|nr:right-handed parallel beta-helix repeat-containing protein [Acidobacteriota bacterium]